MNDNHKPNSAENKPNKPESDEYTGPDQRRSQRRKNTDRREDIRFDIKNEDRRKNRGRRKGDNVFWD